ncbi:class E sortase [Streptomyces triticiradicis]|uniref:Class E sortase n=1 Tax=Streptomyces triticiradicis TaxID=2651189 RepID=A0A7J5DCW2_9ACTN|nr:class E sortase [Streptomyces triticiradicis]KAB1986662.1 class E sortase [Streptomyces triticiradicis]
MTALRPERDSSPYGGEAAYGGAGAFEAAVGGLADPLTDPLPGQGQGVPQQGYGHGGYGPDWYAAQQQEQAARLQAAQAQAAQMQAAQMQAAQMRAAQAQAAQAYAVQAQAVRPQTPAQAMPYTPAAAPSYADEYERTYAPPYQEPATPHHRGPAAAPTAAPLAEPLVPGPPPDDETVALRLPGSPTRVERRARAADGGAVPVSGGRAARRKAARRHGRHGGEQDPQESQETAQGAAGSPRSRMDARRAARASKPGTAVLVSRMVGEVFITTGVLMLLFVTYQLWWSNVRAHQQAGSEASSLQQDWADGKRNPGTFSPGQGFAILHIPKLDVVAPIAEGIDKNKVLDRGMVGHYGEAPLKTAMPNAKTGNFALAGHRNTHGEPFRYINRLKPGDEIVVETQDDYYVYKMASILPVTSPSNTSVLDPVPRGSGFTGPGRYITLTTCTPEFTSKYRMIVWGKMVEDRPRSKGKPDALLG